MKNSVKLLPLLPLFLTSGCQSSLSDSQAQVFESLVQTERAFANTSISSGTRAAFLEFFAADGVVFDAGPVNARAAWEQRPAEGAVLSWGPEIADVSAAGDMGYTSGPWEVRASQGAEPVGWGHFISVWRRAADGTWRVAADGGIAHGPVAVSENGIVDRAGGSEEMSPAHVSDDVAAARAALSALDEEYSRSVAEDGFTASMGGFVDRSARFYRNGDLPLVGSDAIGTSALVTGAAWTDWEAHNAIVSQSGDLGCTYGVVEFQPEQGISESPWYASYYRIWKRVPGSTWRVVVDVLIPYVPSG